jgi:hypothetical protein
MVYVVHELRTLLAAVINTEQERMSHAVTVVEERLSVRHEATPPSTWLGAVQHPVTTSRIPNRYMG